MSTAPPPEEIARDAAWLPQALDTQKALVRIVRMDSAAYRDASFLDDRMLQKPRESVVLPWAQVAGAMPVAARQDARWIFHIGHVGSTLIARLLGEIDGVLSIREPRILRDVAILPKEQRSDYVQPLRELLSRSFGAGEMALVKATSFVSEIAPELVPLGERALFMYASPRNYIGSILAGENSVKEIAQLAGWRAQRATGRATLPPPSNAAETAAAAWACEMTALEAAAEAMADRQVAWADFDVMLESMPAELQRVAHFLGFATDKIPEIAEGPLMRRYSKALEYDYSPSLRRELIAEAEAANRADIDSAIAILQSAAQQSPLLKRALARSH